MENLCNVILVAFFGDVIVMTSLKCSEVWFRHNQFETPQFGQIIQLQIISIENKALGAENFQRLAIFENLLLK